MRTRALVLALLLGGCTVSEENAANEAADTDIAMQSPDVPIIPDDGAQPRAPGNDQEPGAPPPGNGTPPPDNGTPPPPEPSGEVTLAAAPSRVAAGGTVNLTLANGSNRAILYNLCTSALQRAGGAAVETGRICTMELRTLRPGRNTTYAYELPGSLDDGRYRFVASFTREPNGGRGTARSNVISVR